MYIFFTLKLKKKIIVIPLGWGGGVEKAKDPMLILDINPSTYNKI